MRGRGQDDQLGRILVSCDSFGEIARNDARHGRRRGSNGAVPCQGALSALDRRQHDDAVGAEFDGV